MYATLGLLLLTTAFGYSLGVDRRGKTPLSPPPPMEIPLDPNAVYQLRAAAERARLAGDESVARWFETVSDVQRERLLSWKSVGSDRVEGSGPRSPVAPSPFGVASNGG